MMYSRINEKKLLWIHCPKNSGRSQHVWLQGNSIVNEEDNNLHLKVYNNLAKIKGIVHPDHETLEMNYLYGGDSTKEYYPIITMRNPLDWHQSWYHYYKRKNFEENKSDLFGKSFVEYIQWLDDVHSGRIETKRQNGRYHCLMKQSDWFWDGKKYRIENTLDFLNIQRDFSNLIENYFGIKNVKLGHINKTNYKIEKQSYTKETIHIIQKWYEKDFEIYEQIKERK